MMCVGRSARAVDDARGLGEEWPFHDWYELRFGVYGMSKARVGKVNIRETRVIVGA